MTVERKMRGRRWGEQKRGREEELQKSGRGEQEDRRVGLCWLEREGVWK